MAIANRAVSSYLISLFVSANTAKTFDLATQKKKIVTKYKSLDYGLEGKVVSCPRPTCHSLDVSKNTSARKAKLNI